MFGVDGALEFNFQRRPRAGSVKRRDALSAMLAFGAAVPLGACERQGDRSTPTDRTWRVGILLAALTDEAIASQRRAIVERLAQHGFVEGRNLQIDLRRGGHTADEYAEAIGPLVASKPDAILVDTSPLARRTHAAFRTTPIVFTGVADPIGAGLIADFAQPGGNVTGVHFSQVEMGAKRLELVREMLPGARRVMVARYLAGGEIDILPRLRDAGLRLGLELVEIAAVYAGFSAPIDNSVYGKPDAIYCAEPWIFYGGTNVADQIISYAVQQRVPSFFWEAEAAERGATVAYGVNLTQELGRAADQLARILKGANPGELSVDTATKYELVVNRKAAAALGLAIPTAIAARATRQIE